MKITLNQIPETGLSATESLSAAPYALDTEEVKVISPLRLSYRAFVEDETLFFLFSVHCTVQRVCSRCLASTESPFQKEAKLCYPVGKSKVVDVTDDLRQEILLEYPIKLLCREECKGICPVCGQNLNEAVCQCVDQIQNSKRKIQNHNSKFKTFEFLIGI